MEAGCFRTTLFALVLASAVSAFAYTENTATLSVTTSDATAVTATSAELHGTINPGVPAGGWFEWGATTSLGSKTDVVTFGDTTEPIQFALSLRNLQPHTTYYFRAVGYRSAGTVAGDIRSFTTANADSTTTGTTNTTTLIVATAAASSITSNSASLNGGVNPGNASTSVWFNWGTTQSMGTRTDAQTFSASSTAVTAALKNL